MGNTNAGEVFASFESSFQDKSIIPQSLELEWLKKAVARYSIELDPIDFDEGILCFASKLDRYAIDTLAAFMKQYYQEREVSKVNKRVSIIGKDISFNSGGYDKTAARNELEYDNTKSDMMVANQMPTAYV